jgi:hypothetical protein
MHPISAVLENRHLASTLDDGEFLAIGIRRKKQVAGMHADSALGVFVGVRSDRKENTCTKNKEGSKNSAHTGESF